MRYLKSFNESSDVELVYPGLTDRINDILSYLLDDGYSLTVYINDYRKNDGIFAVEISRLSKTKHKYIPFRIDNIFKEEVNEFINQISDEYIFHSYFKAYSIDNDTMKLSGEDWGRHTLIKDWGEEYYDINYMFVKENDDCFIDYLKLNLKKK